ncbi:hypothetical protein FS749_013867 [Ceratobasidium sp. UAMH 11750]|nr:hypothetical protein FS749_013867 [Ceratobasidium sp. UAMH 11750]
MVKYGWLDGLVFNLDDYADYVILLWKPLSGSTDNTLHVPVLRLHDPGMPFPAPGCHRNPSIYMFQHGVMDGGADSIAERSKKTKGSRKAKSVRSQMSELSDGLPKHKRECLNFYVENGVLTVDGKISPVDNVQMLLKKGYRHIYVSRTFAKRPLYMGRDSWWPMKKSIL